MRQTINGADFRRLLISAAASVEIHKQQLNELNVFPVPDGDTGTNMAMTINAAGADLRTGEGRYQLTSDSSREHRESVG